MAEGVLGEIVRHKRAEVAARLAGASFDPPPTRRSLKAALARPGARFIMEVKKASPSGHRSNVLVADAVRAYAPLADALSVLTDARHFGGSLDDLDTARRLFDGPILAKDFIVDPGQVAEARAHGADAVLAILAVLTDGEAGALLAEARRLAMDVLVEVHDEAELELALSLRPRLIGINNRDLRTFETRLETTVALASMIERRRAVSASGAGGAEQGRPLDDCLVITESGIHTRDDVAAMHAAGVHAFLIGEAFMRAPDPGVALRGLFRGRV